MKKVWTFLLYYFHTPRFYFIVVPVMIMPQRTTKNMESFIDVK